MSLDSIANLTISLSAKTPTREGFGIPLLLAAEWPTGLPSGSLTFSASSLADITGAGFAVTGAVYAAAQVAFAQNPAPSSIKIGRRTSVESLARTVVLTVLAATAGFTFALNIGGQNVTYTVPSTGSPTTATIATAIAALVSGHGVTASATGAAITLTGPATGLPFLVSGWSTKRQMSYQDTSTDSSSIAADLSAILAVDADWYGLDLDAGSKAAIVAASAWVEANGKIAAFSSSDTEIASTATTDAASQIQAANDMRSGVWVGNQSNFGFLGFGIMSLQFTVPPGSDTWKFKAPANVTVSDWTPTEIGNMAGDIQAGTFGKNANYYATVAGLPLTAEGRNGGGEFCDIVRGLDWLKNEGQIRYLALFANNPKIPYTDAGASLLQSTLAGLLQECTKAPINLLDPGVKPVVTVPLVSSIDPTVRSTRRFPGPSFTARVAGAVHATTVTGQLTS